MSSPADVKIQNRTKQSITTNVLRASWVEDDAAQLDGKVIPGGEDRTYRVVAKKGHHGEIDLELIGGATGNPLGLVEIKSIKDPQESKNLKVTPLQDGIDMSATGHRSSPDDEDLRRIDILVAQK